MVSESDHRHTLTDKLSFSLEAERNEAAKLGFFINPVCVVAQIQKTPLFWLDLCFLLM